MQIHAVVMFKAGTCITAFLGIVEKESISTKKDISDLLASAKIQMDCMSKGSKQ